VREYELRPDAGFAQTAGPVLSLVDAKTRAVFVNTPHNPTGSVMTTSEQRRLADELAARSIPLIVDEVYHPLYFEADAPSASALPNTIVLGDFAKALSLPGLRIGWIIDRDAKRREALLDLRSYFTISGSPLTEAVGAHALAHAPAILQRLRQVARANLVLLARFMEENRSVLGWAPPAGGTTCFPWLRDGSDSRPVCEALAKAGVLVGARRLLRHAGAHARGFSAPCAPGMQTHSKSSARCSRSASYQSFAPGRILCEIIPPCRGGDSEVRQQRVSSQACRFDRALQRCHQEMRHAPFLLLAAIHEHAFDDFQHLHDVRRWESASRCCRDGNRACRESP
jgi:hypothetical protein